MVSGAIALVGNVLFYIVLGYSFNPITSVTAASV